MEQRKTKRTISLEELEKLFTDFRDKCGFSADVCQNTIGIKLNWDYVKENPIVAYALARYGTNSIDKKRCAQIVLDSKDLDLNFKFAHDIPDADIKAHGQVVLDSNDPYWNHRFARDIEDADIKAHERVILEEKDPYWNYRFASEIKDADIKAHGQAVLDSKDPYYNYIFASEIKDADIKAHGQAVLDSKDPYYNYIFASEIKGADIKAHERVILESKDPKYSLLFVEQVPVLEEADLVAHGKVIAENGTKEFINEYDYILVAAAADPNNSQEQVANYNVALWSFRQALLEQPKNPTRARTKDTGN